MLSFQLLSIQIDITWRKKEHHLSMDKIERHIHANKIEQKITEMKSKNSQYFRPLA